MTVIAKIDPLPDSAANAGPAPACWRRVLGQVRAHLDRLGAQPARTVVLVPYAQLMAEAQRQWARHAPEGFTPRFETTRNWAQRLGGFVPQGLDLAQDAARDTFTARALLERAGLAPQSDALAGPLQEAAVQLAPVAAAVAPARRAAWAESQREAVGLAGEGSALRYEAAVARIALEWVAASRHATDGLFEPGAQAAVEALVVLEGFQPDPLAGALCAAWGERALNVPLWLPPGVDGPDALGALGDIALHPAQDTEDEAQRAAACVLRHVAAGRVPVALASTDRALTRRISALLGDTGPSVRDESGWTLSTTRGAAQVMAALRAAAWSASTDAVLDWLKHVPAVDTAAQRALEKWLRRSGWSHWRMALERRAGALPGVPEALDAVEALRRPLRAARPLGDWFTALRALLQAGGQWPVLEADPAGARVLAELHLLEGQHSAFDTVERAGRALSLAEFTQWANEVLEAARFKPTLESAAPADVVVLPLPQLLARPFAALVLPGCDEKRLQPAPEPPGQWTPAQRQALGLPTREALEAAQRAAWAHALRTPWVDVLWRGSDEGGEPLLASALVLALPQGGPVHAGDDPRAPRGVAPAPVERPLPLGSALPLSRLSASAYADLRHCPYRFYALRLLGLQEADELDAEVDKRDFGTWLHAVLQHFHDGLREQPTSDADERRARLNAAARHAQQAQGLSEGDFLPFASGWPQLREGYLRWLQRHEAEGATFAQAELSATQPLGALELVGTLDRIDHTRPTAPGEGPGTLVIDYKTENDAATRRRLAAGTEDTQLAFYAALMPDDTLRAAYVNVGERGETQMHEEEDVIALRDRLIDGIRLDFERIAAGAPLPALGEGSVCEWCAARGLCRKDFWKD